MTDHRAEETDGSIDIDIVVVERLFTTFADGLVGSLVASCLAGTNETTHFQSGKVNDTINVRMFFEDCIKRFLIGHIELDKIWAFAADQLDAIDHFV